MSTVSTSINQLPVASDITTADYLIIDNGIESRRLNFANFIVGLENVTFAATISSNSSNISILSANQIADETNLSILSANQIADETNLNTLSSSIYGSVPNAVSASPVTHYIRLMIQGTAYALLLSATS